MNCYGCGFAIESGFAFCPKCGARQPVACPVCGHACQPHFAFCPKCGTGLPAAANIAAHAPPSSSAAKLSRGFDVGPASRRAIKREADRRPITVLFADLCGFTTVSEHLDPEDLQQLQNELFEELTASVDAFGGFVDKFVGDALLALFGAPVAHEDDPERSLRAALDMLERTERFGERWRPRLGIPLNLHIGVNTGAVVTGGFGVADAKSYSVTGDTVNTAQRLQAMAGYGEIMVGPLTVQLTRHAFSYDSLGDRALRGKQDHVPVHRLTGAVATPDKARGLAPYGLRAPMIGRDAELGRLTACLEQARAGAAQLVRLTGEAGIGKSRLVEEFLAEVAANPRFADVTVRQAACSPLGEQSYGTLGKVLLTAYGISTSDSPERAGEILNAGFHQLGLAPDEIDRLVPPLFHVIGLGDPRGELQHVQPEQMRRQISYAIRTIFEHRLARGPLLLVVEDLHCADAVSLETLRYLIDRIERRPFMMVTTQRPAYESDPLESNRVNLTALRLSPLSVAEGKALLSAFFQDRRRGLPTDLRDRILQRASGNPLFIEEILRSLIDVGALKREGEHWQIVVGDTGTDIPLGIQAMLLARIDHLPPHIRRLAQEAAVIGPSFDTGLLAAIATEPANIESGLDFLTRAEVIEEARSPGPNASSVCRFRQTLLHDVIYQNLLMQRRIEMHGKIGAAMERMPPQPAEHLEYLARLGHHFSQTEARVKAARYLLTAGDLAARTYANNDAMRLYHQALKALSESAEGVSELPVICEHLADLCSPAGMRDDALEYYERALKCHSAAGEQGTAARILRKIGRLHWDAGRRDRAEAYYRDAAALLESSDDPIEYAHLLQDRGHLAFRMGDHEAAARWADEALQSVQSLAAGEADEQTKRQAALATAEALNTKGVALARLGRKAEAIAEVERSLSVAEDADLLNAACRAYSNLGVLYTVVDPERAIAICRRGYDVAVRIGDYNFQARLLANLAVASCTFTGRCGCEGIPAAEKAVEIDRALDQRDHLPVSLIVLGQIHQCHGRPDLARRYYDEALALATETGEPQLLFPCYDGLATLNLDLDDIAEAERYFALAQEICTRHGLDPETLVVLPFLD